MALYAYEAREVDELNFVEGEVIDIIGKNADDWWIGVVGDRRGLFPGNYVEEIAQ